jgi:hypothetical protein
MNKQKEIDQLKRQLDQLKIEQNNCLHSYGDPKYDPRAGKEEYLTGQYETHGIHRWPITSFRDVTIDRWSRECSKCGKVDYTEKLQEKKTVKTSPKFD